MAGLTALRGSLELSKNLRILRLMRLSRYVMNQCKYSTGLDKPIKFSATRAGQIPICDSLASQVPQSHTVFWFEPHVITLCLAAFLIYFCILHEENDIDEMLKGNPEYQNDYALLAQLQVHLMYCKSNNLETEALKNKIAELRKKLGLKEY